MFQPCPVLLDRLTRQRLLFHGDAGVGRAEKDGKLVSIARRGLRDLNPSRSDSDNSNLLLTHIDPFDRPERRMAHASAEGFKPGPVGEMAFGGQSETAVQKARGNLRSIIAGDMPFTGLIVPSCRVDPHVI